MAKPLKGETVPSLRVLGFDEWRDIARLLAKHMTDAEFQAAWDEFMDIRNRKQQN